VLGGFVEGLPAPVAGVELGGGVDGNPLVLSKPLKTILNFFILTIFYN